MDLYVIWDGPLTAERYRDEILHPFVRAYAGAVGQNFVLMDDDARQSCAALSSEAVYPLYGLACEVTRPQPNRACLEHAAAEDITPESQTGNS